MKHIMAILLAFSSAGAWAALHPDNPLGSGSVASTPAIKRIVPFNGLYRFAAQNEVVPELVLIDGEWEPNNYGASIQVDKNEVVALEFLDNDYVQLTLRLPENEIGKVPEQVIISMDELNELGLSFVEMGTVADLKEKYSGYVETEVAGRTELRARKHKIKKAKRGGGFRRDKNGRIAGGGGNCVRVVKSLTGFSGRAGNGVGMASALQRIGWRIVSFSSRTRGTVCSWSGGRHGKGHVGWFDGSCFQPTYGGNCGSPGSRYRLIKCVHRG